jgi:hypothetical protein
VGVVVGVPGVDRGGVDLDLQSGLLRHLGDVNLGIDVGEAATHLGHQVAGDELERRVRRVDHPGPDLGHLAAIDDPDPGMAVTASVIYLIGSGTGGVENAGA